MSHDNLGFTSSRESIDAKRWAPSSQNDPSSSARKSSRLNVYALEIDDKRKSVQEYDDQEYDPYQNRVVTHPTTDLETLLHLLKGSMGTGILAMPKAFYHAGYVVGLVATLIIGLLCTYCVRLLVISEYELCKRNRVPSLSYPATAEAAFKVGPRCLRRFSRASIHVINLFLIIYQLGTCCVYMMFISTNLKTALGDWVPSLDVRVYMGIILIPVVLLNWIKNLKFLTPCSTIANSITFVGFGIILYYIFREPLTFDQKEAVGNVTNFPLFFGTVLFALEAIGVVMPLENEMKTPRSFIKPCGVLNIGMGSIVLMYAGMGFFGYIRYGSSIDSSITLNLAPNEGCAKAVQFLLALAIYFTHPIQCYVAIDIAWNEYISQYLEKNQYKQFWEYFVRTMIVILTTLLAVAVPELDLFISLFGAFCLSALGLAFPAIIELCTFWDRREGAARAIMVTKNMTLVLFGLLGLVVGTYTSLRDIIHKFS